MWKRPSTLEYPKVWLKFQSDKTKQKFIVKDLTIEYYDITLGYMTNIFLNESAICKPLKILEDPESRENIQNKWLEILKQNMAIICVTEDDIPRVAGIHLTMIRQKTIQNGTNHTSTPPSGQYGKFTRVVTDLKNEGDLFSLFGDAYLGSLGLLVLPEFRGLGVATQMLKARIEMCVCLSLRGTATVFSTPGAQVAAAKAGYKPIASKKPEDCKEFQLEHTLVVMGVSLP